MAPLSERAALSPQSRVGEAQGSGSFKFAERRNFRASDAGLVWCSELGSLDLGSSKLGSLDLGSLDLGSSKLGSLELDRLWSRGPSYGP